jgi:hypothetical protein
MSPRTQARSATAAGVKIEYATEKVIDAATEIFAADPRVRSVGVAQRPDGFGYVAVLNAAVILPQTAKLTSVTQHQGIPVSFIDSHREPETLVKLPLSGPGSPTTASMVPEQASRRPLFCGLQIENFDDDIRTNVIAGGHIIVGTLGCFVKLQNKAKGLLSNNHVVAGQNRGVRGKDRILQPSTSKPAAPAPQDVVGLLSDFVALQQSPAGATVGAGAVLNDVDAGTVELNANNANVQQQYLPNRKLLSPNGFAQAQPGDKVFKVGRTTGLTRGEVTQVAAVVGPILYAPGPCWFRNAIVIEGQNGTMFSDHGDSGSAIVRDDGKILGLLYAGNGQETYACTIDMVMQMLNCSIL